MSDRSKKISELSALTAPAGEDLLVVVDDPSGTPITKKLTIANLLGNSSANVVVYKGTPANSTITVKKGTVMVDDNYLYVATANNTLKRVSLSSF